MNSVDKKLADMLDPGNTKEPIPSAAFSVRVKSRERRPLRRNVFCENVSSGAEQNTIEKVCLLASELISCEWCSVRKLPVLFFQTTPVECVRLRTQLNMSEEAGGQWYDCAGDRK